MALAATRMDEMRVRRGTMRSSFGFHWSSSIALAAFTVVLLGVLLGALLAGQDIRSVLEWIEPLLFLVGIVFGLFIVVLRTMAGWALGFLGSFGVENAAVPLAEFVEELGELVPDGSELTIQGPPGLDAIRLALMVALVVGLGALLMFLARRQSWTQRESEGDDEESVFSPTLIVENLRQLVRAARGRLAVAQGFVGRSGWRRLFVALNIRRIYAQMQRLAARQGYPRTASQTPYEYESIAVRAFPDAVLRFIHSLKPTSLSTMVRYQSPTPNSRRFERVGSD